MQNKFKGVCGHCGNDILILSFNDLHNTTTDCKFCGRKITMELIDPDKEPLDYDLKDDFWDNCYKYL